MKALLRDGRALTSRSWRGSTTPWRSLSTATTTTTIDNEGWLFGHILDGRGGSTPLAQWDSSAVRAARNDHGAWVHLDFREPQAQAFIASCATSHGRAAQLKRKIHVSSLMVADPRKTQPRCVVASDWNGMLLTLQVNFGKRFRDTEFDQRRNTVPFRMWVGRGILITARGRQPEEGAMRLPALSCLLESGIGPTTCGSLASAVISEITSITAESAVELEDEVFALKARKQQKALLAGANQPIGTEAMQELRRQLMPLRYAAISMRRYEVPELIALQTVVRFTKRPEQTIFSATDEYEINEAKARQEALVESLYATIAAGEALENEVAAHVSWEQSRYAHQLTVLGCVLSGLGVCSIFIDLVALLPTL
eukprot:SAG31_NODE_3519_length_4165_cov_2.486227_5_plen_368_part_00